MGTKKSMMTVEDIDKLVKEISDEAEENPPGAHISEDKLLADVLGAIAEGSHTETAASLAAAALKVRKIDFPRWYE